MRADYRVKVCKLLEMMDKHEEYCLKIGLQKDMRRRKWKINNTSTFKSKCRIK